VAPAPLQPGVWAEEGDRKQLQYATDNDGATLALVGIAGPRLHVPNATSYGLYQARMRPCRQIGCITAFYVSSPAGGIPLLWVAGDCGVQCGQAALDLGWQLHCGSAGLASTSQHSLRGGVLQFLCCYTYISLVSGVLIETCSTHRRTCLIAVSLQMTSDVTNKNVDQDEIDIEVGNRCPWPCLLPAGCCSVVCSLSAVKNIVAL
jgi:hypothetical protein